MTEQDSLPAVTGVAAIAPSYADLSDDALVEIYAGMSVERANVIAHLNAQIGEVSSEIERRLRERRDATPREITKIAIPHPRVKIELTAQFDTIPDLAKLEAAAKMLPDTEAVMVVKRTPEWTETHPATVKPGLAVSITALAKKYTGTEVGDLLDLGMQRVRLGDKLTITPLAKALPGKPAR